MLRSYKYFKLVLILLLIAAAPVILNAQKDWTLKKDKDDIKVYTRNSEHSAIKSVKVTCTVRARLSQLTALLLDTKAHEQWVYNTKTSYLVKQLNPQQQIYYSEINLPWPMSNREVVVVMNISQNPVNKVVEVKVDNADNKIAVKEGTVRVPASSVTWTVTPLDKDNLKIEYVGQADPGGSVPAWLVNSFSTKGPFETFKRLKTLVTSPVYAKAQYGFISELAD